MRSSPYLELFILLSCTSSPYSIREIEHKEWHSARGHELRTEQGWLSLAGLDLGR